MIKKNYLCSLHPIIMGAMLGLGLLSYDTSVPNSIVDESSAGFVEINAMINPVIPKNGGLVDLDLELA